MSTARGRELRRRLDDILAPHKRSKKGRESVLLHGQSGCAAFFHHSWDMRADGVRVPRSVHTGLIVQLCSEMCVDTLNDMIVTGRLRTSCGFVRATHVNVMRLEKSPHAGSTASVSVRGPRPYMQPLDIQHALIGTTTPHLGLPIAELLAGHISAIPLYVAINVGYRDRWELHDDHPALAPEYEMDVNEYPNLHSYLRGNVIGPNEIPLRGHNGWFRFGSKRAVMKVDPYKHMIAIVLTPEKKAFMIDSNDARPDDVDAALTQLVKSWGFELVVVELPPFNQEDTATVRAVFRKRFQIDSAVTLAGYCASLALCAVMDVLCTSKYDTGHVRRYVRDIMPRALTTLQQQLCVMLYARAMANDCVRQCLLRVRRNEIPLPLTWPSSISTPSEYPTVKVTIADIQKVV